MDCARPLSDEAVIGDWRNKVTWGPREFHVFNVVRDKNRARFGLWRGSRVQAVVTSKAVPGGRKARGEWRAWVDPQAPLDGISRRRLVAILERRTTFGGLKGRRALRRLAALKGLKGSQ